jgi:hypothetical protein
MKNKTKIFLSFIIAAICGISIFTFFYLSNSNFADEIVFHNSKLKIYAESPLGKRIEFTETDDKLILSKRVVKNIFLEDHRQDLFPIKAEINGKTFIVNSNNIENQKIILNNYTPPGFFYKLKKLTKNETLNLLFHNLKVFFGEYLSIIFLTLFALLLFFLTYTSCRKRKKIYHLILRNLKHLKFYFKTKWRNFLVISFICCLIPLIFSIIFPEILLYQSFSRIQYMLVYGSLVLMFLFTAYFHKYIGNPNTFRFFLTSGIIFSGLLFIFKPGVFQFGELFRDDISKFYVKTLNYNYLEAIITTDSGYLNLIPTSIGFIISKILGFEFYIPEAFQTFTLILYALCFATLSLPIFRFYVKDDKTRLFFAVVLSFFPAIFNFDFVLYNLSFVVFALMYLWIFIPNLEKENNKYKILLPALLFIPAILSKPIFIILLPFTLYGIFKYHRKEITLFYIFLGLSIAILLQFLVTKLNTQNLINLTGLEYGTRYNSAFLANEKNIFISLFESLFVFFYEILYFLGSPLIVKIFPSKVIYLLSGLFVLFLIRVIFKLLSKSGTCSYGIFFIGALLTVLASSFIYCYNTESSQIFPESSVLSKIVVENHRYLVPAKVSVFFVLIILLQLYFRNKNTLKSKQNQINYILISFFSLIFGSFTALSNSILTNPHYSKSYWREFFPLIQKNPQSFYIPYINFPQETECIKNKLDRITDIETAVNSTIEIDNILQKLSNYKIEYLILNDAPQDISIYALTSIDNKKIKAIRYNYATENIKAEIFYFPISLKIDKLVLSSQTSNEIFTIRLVGAYEY